MYVFTRQKHHALSGNDIRFVMSAAPSGDDMKLSVKVNWRSAGGKNHLKF